MLTNKEFEQLSATSHDLTANFSFLQKEAGATIEQQTDIAHWQQQLAHVKDQIPCFTPDQYRSSGIEGISEIDGMSWKYWIIPEPFQQFKPYVDRSGKVSLQNKWSLLTLITPTRTPQEKEKAKAFVKTYGNALHTILLERAEEAKRSFGSRRG